ncbi:MAG: zinc-ribbon domain-containing protein [Candidatus Heimdallarchaeota archaeon]
MSKNRYYSKKDYKGDLSLFGTAAVLTLVGVLSIVFRILEIDFIGLSSWGYWLFIPAFFTATSAFGHLYTDRRMRNNLLSAVQNRSGNVSLDNLSMETGIKSQNILRILVDIRATHSIQYRYDVETGDIILGDTVRYEKSPEFVSPMPKKQMDVIFPSGEVSFCPYCGHKSVPNSSFCENCGSNLQ